MEIGILILRLVVGLGLAAHGAQKLFGWFGGGGLKGTAQVMEHLGFLPGGRHALAAGLAEFGGGLLLALGLATPLGAAVVFSVMIVAGVSVHLSKGFFAHQGGYEYTLVLGLAALSVAFTGPGPLSIDSVIGLDYSGYTAGLAALAVGIVGAAVQLSGRKAPPTAPEGWS